MSSKRNKVVDLYKIKDYPRQLKKQRDETETPLQKAGRIATIYIKPGNFIMSARIIKNLFNIDKLADKMDENDISVYTTKNQGVYIDSKSADIALKHFVGDTPSNSAISRIFSNKAELYAIVKLAIENAEDMTEHIKNTQVQKEPLSHILKTNRIRF